MTTPAPPSPSLFDLAMKRLRPALAGGAILQLPVQTACVDEPRFEQTQQADWAQYEGQRNTDLVSYTGDHWSVCRHPNTRFGCGTLDLIVKVRVRPVAGADLAWKRVGAVYRPPGAEVEQTAVGYYVTTWGNGDEEWHVPMPVQTWQSTVVFNAWYQDGAGATWFDDNQGELHVVNEGPSYNVVRVEPWTSTVTVGAGGVFGQLSLQLTDLDYDKQLAIVATKDGWNTVIELGIGSAGELNKWYWAEDFPWSPGRERWQIDLDLPGGADAFEYAVVYRHGVVNGARTYEFWDNNFGANYRVEAGPQ